MAESSEVNPAPPASTQPGSSVTMPPRNPQRNTGRPATPRREADLSGLLTTVQKTELIAVVTAIMDTMQQRIICIFDASSPEAGSPSRHDIGKHPSWRLQPMDINQGKQMLPLKENASPGKLEAAAGERTPLDPKPQDNKVDLSLSQAELKKEALAALRKWQASVTKRIADISVIKETSAQQAQLGAARSFPKGGGSKAANRAQPLPPLSGPLGGQLGRGDAKTWALAEGDPALMQRLPTLPTSLSLLPTGKRGLLLHAMLLLLLSLEHYNAHSRVLLLSLASALRIPPHVLADDEIRIARSLSQVARELPGAEVATKKPDDSKPSRRGKSGLAGAPSLPLVGVASVLAAPLAAAGFGSVMGEPGLGSAATASLLGAMAENAPTIGSLFGIGGSRAAGRMMESYGKDILDFALLPVRGTLKTEFREAKDVQPIDRRLRFTITTSGWLNHPEELVDSWRILGHHCEVYTLRWELESLMKMGNSIRTVVRSAAWSAAKKEMQSRSACSPFFQSITRRGGLQSEQGLSGSPETEPRWPASLLRISKIVDNPWSVGMVRADKAGSILSEAITNRIQGERGVTLVGFSLGARAIYACLMNLAERRLFGLVENVVLMGTPAPADRSTWSSIRSVVSGRVINVFSEDDYILAFLYRTSSFHYGVAGLNRVEGVVGVENADATDLVTGHWRYPYVAGRILKGLGWDDLDPEQVARNERALTIFEEKLARDEQMRQGSGLQVGMSQFGGKNTTRGGKKKWEVDRLRR